MQEFTPLWIAAIYLDPEDPFAFYAKKKQTKLHLDGLKSTGKKETSPNVLDCCSLTKKREDL